VAEAVIHASAPAVMEAAPREAAPPPFTVTRRPALELSLPLAAAGRTMDTGRTGGVSELGIPDGFDLSSPLDVPAFLRRQN
jgi:hypothetical protein